MNELTQGSPTQAQDVTAPSSGAVTTIRKEDAVTTAPVVAPKAAPIELFVANVDGRYVRFEKLEHVPAGCRTYTTKKELLGQTQKQVEAVYCHVKGIKEKTFKDKETAADNLWLAFSELPLFVPKIPVRTDSEGAADDESDVADDGKKKYQKKREVDIYRILPESEKSRKATDAMAPQAKAVIEIIRGDGKTEYTEDQLRSLMEANKGKLRTKQTPWRIFQYYRSKLISVDILVQQ